MRVNNIPPVLVPEAFWRELDSVPKAYLIDLIWSLAGCGVESADDPVLVIEAIRRHAEAVNLARRAKRRRNVINSR